ncbi:hypothetical protein SeMB42_g08027, partial [Synchytrium endobioticum]
MDFHIWANDVDTFFDNYQEYLDSEVYTLETMKQFISHFEKRLSISASGSDRRVALFEKLHSRSRPLFDRINERRNAWMRSGIKLIEVEMKRLRGTYVHPSQFLYALLNFEAALVDFQKWANYVATFVTIYEQYLGSEHIQLLVEMGIFIAKFQESLAETAKGDDHLVIQLHALHDRNRQLLIRIGHIKERIELRPPQAHQSTDAEAHSMFIDYFEVGGEWEHQRLPHADEAPTRSANTLRDVPSRQSNPQGYSRHGSTYHIGSGSTSGGPRFSDHSSHGAGPS